MNDRPAKLMVQSCVRTNRTRFLSNLQVGQLEVKKKCFAEFEPKWLRFALHVRDSHYTFAIVDLTDPGFRRCAIPSGDARMGDGRAY